MNESILNNSNNTIVKQKDIKIEEQKNAVPVVLPLTSSGKIDKSDPRTTQHYIKFVNHLGATVKLWECSICGREFQHLYMLKRHLPGHTDERNYHCLICGKSFRQLSTLSQHRTIHSHARPHNCMICGKTFNRISTLISHRKTHLDVKPFKCHICSKGFHQKGNLRNHLFSHTNERPYRCALCDKGFNQQSNLTCHLKKVHPESENKITKSKFSRAYPQPSTTLSSIHIPMNFNNNGILVDTIHTPQMDEILQQHQVPFGLLRHNGSRPVLVKIFIHNTPKGKHMLVPVTANDLMHGGKLILGENANNTIKTEYLDANNPLIHLQVPLAAIFNSFISPDGEHTITVHSPINFSGDKYNRTTAIEETNSVHQNELIIPDVLQNNSSDYKLMEIGNLQGKNGIPNDCMDKFDLTNKNNFLYSMALPPIKDPVLNDTQQIGDGNALLRIGMQFDSPQHLLDSQGPPSYATDFDCRNLQLFEPLDCIDTGKIKHEMTTPPTSDTW